MSAPVARSPRALSSITRLYVTSFAVAGALLLALAGATWWMLKKALDPNGIIAPGRYIRA